MPHSTDILASRTLYGRSTDAVRDLLGGMAPVSSPGPAVLADQGLPPWLLEVRQALTDDSIRVVSFDFWDTLVVRLCRRPVDVFASLGARLAAQELLAPGVRAGTFKALRVRAEAQARAAVRAAGSTEGEVTLWQIYRNMPRAVVRTTSLDQLIDLEVAEERRLIRPHPVMLRLVDEVRRSGRRLAVASDTYLSAAQLQHLLPDVGAFDFIFTSSDHKTGKSGGLLPILAQAFSVAPAQVLHIGDNPQADVTAAQTVGMRAVLVPTGSPWSHAIQAQEEQWLRAGAGLSDPDAAAPGWDESLTALRHRLVSMTADGSLTHASYGGFVLGPLIAGYLRWTRRMVAAHQCDAVVGLMREGGFLADISGLDHTAMFISRRVVRHAALVEPDEAALRGLLMSRGARVPAATLLECGVPAEVLPEEAYAPVEWPQLDGLCQGLLKDTRVVSALRRCGQVAHQAILKQFDDAVPGLADRTGPPPRIALVDVGWGASIQAGIAAVLHKAGRRVDLVGLYFMLDDRAVNAVSDSSLALGYLHQPGDDCAFGRQRFRILEILEQALTPDMGSTARLTPQGRPILSAPATPLRQRQDIVEIQNGIRAFCAFGDAVDLPPDPSGPSPALSAIWMRAMTQPSEAEAELFRDWVHDDNVGGGVDPLIGTEWMDLAPYMTPRHLVDAGMADIYWPYGALAIRDSRVAEQAVAVIRDRVDPRLFENPLGRGQTFSVIVEDEDGNHESLDLPVVMNAFGRFCSMCTLPLGAVPSTISMPQAAESLQLEHAVLTVRDDRGGRLLTLDLLDRRSSIQWTGLDGQARSPLLPALHTTCSLTVEAVRADLGLSVLDAPVTRIAIAGGWRYDASMPMRMTPLSRLDAAREVPVRGHVDRIAGLSSSDIVKDKKSIEAGEAVTIAGWIKAPAQPGSSFLLLRNGKGQRRMFPAKRIARPDVSTVVEDTSGEALGIQAVGNLKSFAGTRVQMCWVHLEDGEARLYTFPEQIAIEIPAG